MVHTSTRTHRLLRRRSRPVTVQDRMSYSGGSSVHYGISTSETALGSCTPRLNARTGGYDMPLPFEEEEHSTTTFVTDTSTVKVDNTTTATSKEFLPFRLKDRRQGRKRVQRSSSTKSNNSFESDWIDQKLRSRMPRLLHGRLRNFYLVRKLEASGRTELVSEDDDDSEGEDEVVSVRPRPCFVLPDETPLTSTPIRKPFLGQRNRTVSSSSDSEGFEVVTQGDDAVSTMIVTSSSQHALAGKDAEATEESNEDDTTSCLSGIGSSMVSDIRLMNASEPGALRLTTGSLQHHDQRFSIKVKSSPVVPRQRRRFPFLRKSGVPEEDNLPPPMDSEEQQRIERKRQQYLAQQRERELARVSKEQRDRVFNSIIGKSVAERQDIWNDILEEAKARGKYRLNCSGYAPHMDRSGSIATWAVQCGSTECPVPPVFQFKK